MSLLVYIAGPFTAATRWGITQNIYRAREAAAAIRAAGVDAFPVVPHQLCSGIEDIGPPEFWYAGTLEIMRRCDVVMLLEEWVDSVGAKGEHAEARRLGIPVVHDVGALREAVKFGLVKKRLP